MTKVYEVNVGFINMVMQATSKDRHHLKGVFIEDIDGFRHYTATDGHILFSIKESITGETLEEPLSLYFAKEIKHTKGISNGFMTIVDKDTVVVKTNEKAVADIIDCCYPNWRNVVPQERVLATEFAMFDPDLLKKCINFNCKVKSTRPYMQDSNSPAMWEEKSGDIEQICIIMPLRV